MQEKPATNFTNCAKIKKKQFVKFVQFVAKDIKQFAAKNMSTVISVENLSKTYHLGQIGTGAFSRDLEVWGAKLRGKLVEQALMGTV